MRILKLLFSRLPILALAVLLQAAEKRLPRMLRFRLRHRYF